MVPWSDWTQRRQPLAQGRQSRCRPPVPWKLTLWCGSATAEAGKAGFSSVCRPKKPTRLSSLCVPRASSTTTRCLHLSLLYCCLLACCCATHLTRTAVPDQVCERHVQHAQGSRQPPVSDPGRAHYPPPRGQEWLPDQAQGTLQSPKEVEQLSLSAVAFCVFRVLSRLESLNVCQHAALG